MTAVPLQALLIGGVRPLGPRGIPSGIAKAGVDRPLTLGPLGFAGDAQGDTKHHGGPEKAVHHYALDHYPTWTSEIDHRDVLGTAGAFGENLSTLGLTEDDVAVGDVFTLGSAIVEVSQGRQPCWKLNERFGQPDMARRVQASGRTGWYYRVLQSGEVSPDSDLQRIDRAAPAWNRLILPNGRSIVLERQRGADASGYAGLEDGVDYHWWDLMKAAGLSTLMAVGAELATSDEDRLIRAIRDGAQDTVNQAGQQIVQRQLQVEPTLTIRPGFPVRVIVGRDLVLEPYGAH